jgi:hypothetical protein
MAIHYFPRALAIKYGVREAIVLRLLAYKVRRSRNIQDGKKWYYQSVAKLAKAYFPYLPASTLSAILRRLTRNKAIEIGNYNKWSADKTQWFHVPQEISDETERHLIRFDVNVAKVHGLPAAVLIENFRHQSKRAAVRKKGLFDGIEMFPQQLSQLLPFSEATIKRALKVLIVENYLFRHPQRQATYIPSSKLTFARDGSIPTGQSSNVA